MKLTKEEWAILSALLDKALDLPAGERTAWIAALQGADEAFKTALQEMFASSGDATGEVLPTLSKVAVDTRAACAAAGASGEMIGPYRLISEIGRGGMGAVWLAERADGAMQRTVALKLPVLGSHDQHLRERFARERDILARLEHPRIARLYDAGIAASGQPYLALEYVQGTCLTEHCDAARLAVKARIALFLQVLDAVQYAHSHLVVHRDLKPSNMLVTAGGELRLLDFGISKLLVDSVDVQSQLTEIGGRALTLAYASPEQLAGTPITIASDVYSLGVVLYELLTGKQPYRLRRDSRGALEEAILEADVTRPSAAPDAAAAEVRDTTPRQLRKALAGDLDTIVLKAMKKDAGERYPTAQAFADDLRRHLRNEAVLARPDTVVYRSGKFVRRHRLGVSLAAVLALTLGAGVAGVVWEGRIALTEAARAKAVQDFLVGLFNAADPVQSKGRDISVRELLDRGAGTLKGGLDDQPQLKSTLEGVLVELYGKLADERKALPLAESRRDLVLRTAGPSSLEYGDALYALARIQGSLGANELADQTYRDAEAVFRRHPKERAGELLLIPRHRAFHAYQLHRPEDARRLLEGVLPGIEKTFGPQSWEAVEAKDMLAAALQAVGNDARAAALHDELAPVLDRPPPAHVLDAATLRANYALREGRARHYAVAERELRRSIAEFDRTVGADNSPAIAMQRSLGTVLLEQGRYAEAADIYGAAAQRAGRFFGEHHPETALNQSYRIEPLVFTGRVAQAEAIGRQAATDAPSQAGLTASEIRSIRRRLTLAVLLAGKAGEALALLDALDQEERAAHDGSVRHATTLLYRAGALEAIGRHAAAAAAAEEARSLAGDDAVLAAKAEMTEAIAAARAGDGGRAESLATAAEKRLQGRLAPEHPLFQLARLAQAEALAANESAADAAKMAAAARQQLQGAGAALPAALPLVF